MSTWLSLPRDTEVRVFVTPVEPAFVVVLAVPPLTADLKTVAAPSGLKAIVTHDEGTFWPDNRGCSLANEVLRRGGVAAFGFETLADALACRKRLEWVREP